MLELPICVWCMVSLSILFTVTLGSMIHPKILHQKLSFYAKANQMAHVYAKANQMAEVSCWIVNSRLSKIKAKMKTKMAWNFSLLLKVSAKEQGSA